MFLLRTILEDMIREEPEELMCEKWLTFDNKLVLEILVEACRPRTREQCAKEFIMFLKIAMPQKFKVNAESSLFAFHERPLNPNTEQSNCPS